MHCRVLEQNPNANRAFAKLAQRFVIAHLDTKDGRAPFVKKLKVQRNQTYALVLGPDGREIGRLTKPRTLEEIIVFLQMTVPPPEPAT